MVKINTLISKNVDVQSKLVENNLDLENEFKAKLKVRCFKKKFFFFFLICYICKYIFFY